MSGMDHRPEKQTPPPALPQAISWRGWTVRTDIRKTPVQGRCSEPPGTDLVLDQ
jgi:hypothetical protein